MQAMERRMKKKDRHRITERYREDRQTETDAER